MAGRKCEKCCVFPWFCGFAGWESQVVRTGGCGGSAAQDVKICTTPARESDGRQNRQKLTASEHFWKLKSPKFALRLRARTIWKLKSLKIESLAALLKVEVGKICTTPARDNDLEVCENSLGRVYN